jgi:oligoribonuclease NrnB/cAMP/cGMP phosphodiesterase (DHH superfamily)
MKFFYHNYSDGKCAVFWVYLSAGITDDWFEANDVFMEMDYTTKFPIEAIRPNEQIYIVDFSISPDEMRELLKITTNVTWIDHHKTAIEKYKDFEYEIKGIRYDGVAGCMLTYCYLHHMTSRGVGPIIKPFDLSMTDDAPMFTKLIADWDVWKFEYGENTKLFQTAFYAYNFDPESEKWLDLLSKDSELDLIKEGTVMMRYRDSWAEKYLKKIGFETEFYGYKCFALNLGMANSEYFKSLPADKYDILIPFSFNGDLFVVSLYSKTVDVSKIAMELGGGGHKCASGFQCKELPFKKINERM